MAASSAMPALDESQMTIWKQLKEWYQEAGDEYAKRVASTDALIRLNADVTAKIRRSRQNEDVAWDEIQQMFHNLVRAEREMGIPADYLSSDEEDDEDGGGGHGGGGGGGVTGGDGDGTAGGDTRDGGDTAGGDGHGTGGGDGGEEGGATREGDGTHAHESADEGAPNTRADDRIRIHMKSVLPWTFHRGRIKHVRQLADMASPSEREDAAMDIDELRTRHASKRFKISERLRQIRLEQRP